METGSSVTQITVLTSTDNVDRGQAEKRLY